MLRLLQVDQNAFMNSVCCAEPLLMGAILEDLQKRRVASRVHSRVTTQSPPVITQSPPVITQSPPVITQSPPVITQSPPVSSSSSSQLPHDILSTAIMDSGISSDSDADQDPLIAGVEDWLTTLPDFLH